MEGQSICSAEIPATAAPAQDASALPTFPQAVDAHKAMVYSILWHFLRDRALAEEVAQDVFLALHRNWKAIASSRHLIFWLRRVTTQRAIDLARKRKIRPETSLEECSEPAVLEQLQDPLLSSYLERMLASLPEKQRLLIVLRYGEEMALEEIAELLNMNLSTVKTQISRALELLRQKTLLKLSPLTDAPK